MAALAESGRSKLDVEVSYSSSDRPAGLSTAEFGNHSRQETQQQQQQQQQPQQQPQSQPQKIQQQPQSPQQQLSSLGTKLKSVPLSVAFDLSVFATHDRHGRLTLHPVLRTAGDAAAAALSAADGGESGDLGRNNCAKASIMVHYPQAGGRGCQQQLPAETDFSTASRVSCSGAAAAATAATAASEATAETPRAQGSSKYTEYASAWPDLPPQHMYMHLYDEDSCVEGSGRTGSSISGRGSSFCCSGSITTAVLPGEGGPQLKQQQHHHQHQQQHQQQPQQQKLKHQVRRQHHHQCQHPSCWDCQSELPKFTAIPNRPTSSTTNNSTSSRRHRHHHHRRRHHRSSSSRSSGGGGGGGVGGGGGSGLSAGSLVRIVRRLEALLGRADGGSAAPSRQPQQHQLQHQHQHQHQHQQRRGRTLVSPLIRDLKVSDLRQEYVALFRG